MKTPQVPALPGMTPLGIKPYAQILAEAPLKPKANQEACDVGLFGDDAKQLDLIDIRAKPVSCP
jgi:hypothetical protein